MPAKQHRLIKERDFKQVNSKGTSFFSPYFRLRFIKTKQAMTRYAITVGVRTSKKATVRNKLRRRVSEIFRGWLPKIKPGYDIIISIKTPAINCGFDALEKAVINSLRRAKLLA